MAAAINLPVADPDHRRICSREARRYAIAVLQLFDRNRTSVGGDPGAGGETGDRHISDGRRGSRRDDEFGIRIVPASVILTSVPNALVSARVPMSAPVAVYIAFVGRLCGKAAMAMVSLAVKPVTVPTAASELFTSRVAAGPAKTMEFVSDVARLSVEFASILSDPIPLTSLTDKLPPMALIEPLSSTSMRDRFPLPDRLLPASIVRSPALAPPTVPISSVDALSSAIGAPLPLSASEPT